MKQSLTPAERHARNVLLAHATLEVADQRFVDTILYGVSVGTREIVASSNDSTTPTVQQGE